MRGIPAQAGISRHKFGIPAFAGKTIVLAQVIGEVPMSYTRHDVLNKIQRLSGLADFLVARELLESPETEPFDPPIAGKTAEERIVKPSDIVRTWNARLQNANSKGFNMYGCAHFVKSLRELPADARVFNLALKNVRMLGIFCFREQTWEPVGFVIVRHDEVEKVKEKYSLD